MDAHWKIFALLVGLAVTPSAHAQEGPRAHVGPATSPQAVGAYQGVVPGRTNRPPRAPEAGGRRVVTWPGFQLRPDGASRFFIQTNGPVVHQVLDERGRIVVRLRDTGIHLTNTRRWLETRFFNTPVTRARIERRGGDTVLSLDVRAGATPSITTEQAPNGYYFVFIEFPPGNYAPPAEAPSVRVAPEGVRTGTIVIGN